MSVMLTHGVNALLHEHLVLNFSNNFYPRPKSSGSLQKRAPQHPRFSKGSEITTLSVVEFPSEDTFSGNRHHRRPATVPAAISCEQLFNFTSGVAANMVLDKEMVNE